MKMKVIFYNFVYILIFLLFKFLGKIPRVYFIKLSYIVSSILSLFDTRHKKIAIDNLCYVYGCDNGIVHKSFVRDVFSNLCQIIFEIAWSFSSSKSEMDNIIKIEGKKNILNSFAKGKGILILTGHIGAWELLPYAVAKVGINVNIVYRSLDFKPLDRFIGICRSKFGGKLISTKCAKPKIIDALNKSEAVGFLIDQSADWFNGVWVNFFGHRTCTSSGIALFALDMNVPVVPVFVFREKEIYKVIFKEEVQLINTGDRRRDVEINTLNYSKIIEREVCRYPEQWLWIHRRWKNRAYCFRNKF